MGAAANDSPPTFTELEAAGLKLCAIERGKKAPIYDGWNVRPMQADSIEALGGGAGLLHVLSGTCALDIDDMELARPWLAERGIDIDALLAEPSAVMISSGRPGRAKLLYKLKRPLRTLRPKGSGLELRCATADGHSVQDVLPPSIHPITNKPYEWKYGDELIAHWSNIPPIPAQLARVWREAIDSQPASEVTNTAPQVQPMKLVRKAIYTFIDSRRKDVANYEDWLDVGMRLHEQTGGALGGLQIWDEWSRTDHSKSPDGSPRYKGFLAVKAKWDSFSSGSGKRTVGMEGIFREMPAEAEEFDIIEPTLADSVPPIPKAQHLCTDQANAERLQKRYGHMLITVSGTFHAYDGKRWKADDGLPQRFACELSKIVQEEIEKMEMRVAEAQRAIPDADIQAYLEHPRNKPLDKTEEGQEYLQLKETLVALKKWSKKCEMKATQDAALGLLKKLVAVDADQLDSDPWSLNCENGTVDLRSGELREHCASDYITKLAPVPFNPAATADRFQAFLAEVFDGAQALIEFMQRWVGYGATGSTREQCLVIHWGAGSNGKSTFIGTLASVLGDYATPLPTGMLTAKNSDSRHPAELAKLRGARLVTASESEDGAKLREAFVKEITGSDRLAARQMYGEWFSFQPTHKLQMLTNHKPQIRGSDHGIWRRLLFVPYTVTFGTAEELSAGKAARRKDPALPEALEREKAGVLNWIIRGAKGWCVAGLQPPAIVLEAGQAYREEQDRIGEFIRERCRADPQARTTPSTLYRAYRDWCNDVGIEYPVTQQRFLNELEQRVSAFQRGKSNGARFVKGVAVMPEEADLMA